MAEKERKINFDINSTPLQIQTDSVLGSGDILFVRFIGQNSGGSVGIDVIFTDPPTYDIGYCGTRTDLIMPGTEKYRIWTFQKENNTIQLLCNGVEIYNLNYAEYSDDKNCIVRWSLDFTHLRFVKSASLTDTASDFYRPYTKGNLVGLSMKHCTID